VCEAHFIEETKIKVAGLTGHKALVIDVFAEKENLTPEMKAEVEGLCAFFDLGASFIIDQLNEQRKQLITPASASPTTWFHLHVDVFSLDISGSDVK
jgi:hypothetical protein